MTTETAKVQPPHSKGGDEIKGDVKEGTINEDAKARERLAFVLKVLIGYTVTVKVKDGIVYEGIYSSAIPEGSSLRITLHFAKVIENPQIQGSLPVERPQELLELDSADVVQMTAKDVRIGARDVGPVNTMDDAGGFGTDAAISRGRGGREGRELERWVPEAHEMDQMMHLEEAVTHHESGWDQFALNERKFGIRTDYHEEFYTTKLDPTKSKISVEQAARLAAEIERGNKSGANLHVLEERGVLIDDGQMDEEDRYGAVIRSDAVPPPPPPPVGRPVVPPPPPPASGSNGGKPTAWGRGPPSAPIGIAMDARKDVNKLRAQMVVPGKKTSPYGTPKSPLSSPLVGNAQKLEALNLDPGVTRVDERTRREFEQFKAAEQAQQTTSGKVSLEEMRSFSQQVGSKLQRAQSADKKTADQAASDATTKDGAPSTSGTSTPPSSSTKLNPFAKEFSFNINAKTFTPGGSSTTPASSSTPVPSTSTPTGGMTTPRQGTYGPRSPMEGAAMGGHHQHINGPPPPGRPIPAPGVGNQYDDGYRGRDDRRPRDDGRRPNYDGNAMGRPPPPDGMHPPPPGKSHPVGSPQMQQVPGMMPVMAPMMMMGPGGMPGGQTGFFMVPGGGRPAGAMFMPAGGPTYVPGRPVMVPMMGPGGVPMPPAVMGMGGYPGAGQMGGVPPNYQSGGGHVQRGAPPPPRGGPSNNNANGGEEQD